ncbi:hypothetical protein NP493_643g01023 [Ridgeia piscesae]|uniref:COMM domain-containing protein 5 n=1 Tax=Ridgeia piscesae TaxID=27915 RepID=A0AAD9KSB0_RIDPI|nr:hypothetical protein NP493_643g01023 [Ridgeia piscesae]
MSIVHVVGGGAGGAARSGPKAERTLFVGPRIPDELKRMIKHMKKLDKATLRKCLQVIVAAFEGREIEPTVYRKLLTDSLDEETLAVIYTGLFRLLQLALRLPLSSLKQESFKEDLQELNIPDDFIPDITSVVFGSRRPAIDQSIVELRPRLPKLEGFKWRVDIGISTSVLHRTLQPTLMTQMTLGDGKIHTFEMPVHKFQELRYSVASVLKEMEDLEKRNILKIDT